MYLQERYQDRLHSNRLQSWYYYSLVDRIPFTIQRLSLSSTSLHAFMLFCTLLEALVVNVWMLYFLLSYIYLL